MGSSERKERQKEELRRNILEASLEIYARDGFEGLSIRKIAEKIDYSPAAIYLYFKDKDALLCGLQEEGFRIFNARKAPILAAEMPAIDRLDALGEDYIRFAFEHPEYFELMFVLRSPMRALGAVEEWTEGIKAYETLRDVVARCMDEGSLPREAPDVAALAYWGAVHGIASLALRERIFWLETENATPTLLNAKNYLRKILDYRND